MFGRRKKGFYGYDIKVGCDCHNCSPDILERHRSIVHTEHLNIFNTIHPGSRSGPATRPGYMYVRIGSHKGPSMKNPAQPNPAPKRKLDGGIRLFRAWYLRGTNLCSLSAHYAWKHELNKSGQENTLDYVNPGNPPLRSSLVSDLGFYGFKSYDCALMDVGNGKHIVFGTVICWGWVVVAEQGCRCQYAKVESLVDPYPYSKEMMEPSLNILVAAEKYSAQVISPDTAHNLAGGLIPYRREQ